jgi:hypothetical protein
VEDLPYGEESVMLPIDPDALSAQTTALHASAGRPAAEVSLRASDGPRAPCAHCFGRGCYTEDAKGVRRVFDPRDYYRVPGARYVATCPACDGLRSVRITSAERDAIAKRQLREARKGYRALRTAVCRERAMSEGEFDALARSRLEGATAASWLAAAEAIASVFGVK